MGLELQPSDSVAELVKHWIDLVAGCIVWFHEWAIVRDDHRNVGKSPFAELDVSVAWSSITWPRTS